MRILLILLVIAAIGGAAYIRLSPINVAQAHLPTYPSGAGDYPQGNGFVAARLITTTPEGVLEILDRTIRATPRTTHLAGSVEEGLISYVTRSRIFAFPDITTIEVSDDIDSGMPHLRIAGRARFGASDIGVNQARISGWLAQLGPLVVPLP